MSDAPSGSGAAPSDVPPAMHADRPPFPIVRLVYALGYALIAYVVFWLVLALALLQFVVVAINGRVNDELKHFSSSMVQYLWDLLAYVAFMRDEQPFPLGPFPKSV